MHVGMKYTAPKIMVAGIPPESPQNEMGLKFTNQISKQDCHQLQYDYK